MLSNLKTLIGLLIVLAGLAYWVSQGDEHRELKQQYLMPDWQQDETQIDVIDQVILKRGSEQLVFNKTAETWQLNDGFFVEMGPLVELFQALQNAQIEETKTANPDKHAQLELSDGDLAVYLYQAGQLAHAIHVGKKTATGLTFVRRSNENQTYTVSGIGPISFNQDNWTLKTVVDIAPEDVVSVKLIPSAGEKVVADRDPDTAAFRLVDIPEGYQLQNNSNLNQLFGGLSRLMIEEAIPTDTWLLSGDNEPEVAVTAEYLLKSGVAVVLNLYEHEELYYLTIDSSQYPQYKNWVMKIAEYKFNALNRNQAEFIAPIPDQAQPEEEAVQDPVSEPAS